MADVPDRRVPPGVELRRETVPGSDRILTHDALAFVADLQRRFGPLRLDLLERREERQAELDAGARPDFLAWRPGRSATRTGPSPRRRPTSTTGGSRSPARPSPR